MIDQDAQTALPTSGRSYFFDHGFQERQLVGSYGSRSFSSFIRDLLYVPVYGEVPRVPGCKPQSEGHSEPELYQPRLGGRRQTVERQIAQDGTGGW